MNDNITSITTRSEDNRMWTIVDMLRETIKELDQPDQDYNRAVLVLVRDDESTYDCGYRAANISCSQALAALKIAEQQFLEEMGY